MVVYVICYDGEKEIINRDYSVFMNQYSCLNANRNKKGIWYAEKQIQASNSEIWRPPPPQKKPAGELGGKFQGHSVSQYHGWVGIGS